MPHFLKKRSPSKVSFACPSLALFPRYSPGETVRAAGRKSLSIPPFFPPCAFLCALLLVFSLLLGGKGEIPGGTCPHSHLSPFSSLHTPNFATRKEKPPPLLSCVSVE